MDQYNNGNQNIYNPNQCNNGYQQPQYVPQNDVEPAMTLGDWMLTMLLMMIPCANLVLLFVWAFSPDTPKSKSNWAKASLIFMAIAIVLMIAFISFFYNVIFAPALSEYINKAGIMW